MKRTSKMVAWLCIFSILLMGCYTSTLIDPKGDDKEQMNSHNIEYVITKDGIKHEFETPPAIVNNAIVPTVSVSIPYTNVARFYSGDGKDRVSLEKVRFIVTQDSTKYEFDTPPTMSHQFIVGLALIKSASIPLSDVSEVCTTEFDRLSTVMLVIVGAGLVAFGVLYASTSKGVL
jgi:hypothetical protein